MTTKAATTYRVSATLIQLQGRDTFASQHQIHERHLRRGDMVPMWVPTDEIQRLLDSEFIEVAL